MPWIELVGVDVVKSSCSEKCCSILASNFRLSVWVQNSQSEIVSFNAHLCKKHKQYIINVPK